MIDYFIFIINVNEFRSLAVGCNWLHWKQVSLNLCHPSTFTIFDPLFFIYSLKQYKKKINDVLSLLNDLNNLAPQSFLSSYTNSLGLSTFNEVSQEYNAIVQISGAVAFILFYLGHQTSVTFSIAFFMLLYVIQRLAKFFLFYLKSINTINAENLNPERLLYGFSIMCNVGQMIFG